MGTKTIKHKKLSLEFELLEITQGMLEKYQIALERYTQETNLQDIEFLAGVVFNGAMVRSAMEAEILLDDLDVDSMLPAEVTWLSGQLSKHLTEALTVPSE